MALAGTEYYPPGGCFTAYMKRPRLTSPPRGLSGQVPTPLKLEQSCGLGWVGVATELTRDMVRSAQLAARGQGRVGEACHAIVPVL